MSSEVVFHVSLGRESLVTDLARVRLLVGVDSDVDFQVRFFREYLAAARKSTTVGQSPKV